MSKIYGLLTLMLMFILLSAGCSSSVESPTTSQQEVIDTISSIDVVIHNHWTENNVNDGKIVYIDLANPRNEAISGNTRIEPLIVELTVKGLDEAYEDYSVLLFNKTCRGLKYSEIAYPGGQGIVILFSELQPYPQECCTAIWAKVTLPDGRIIQTNDPYDFDISKGQSSS